MINEEIIKLKKKIIGFASHVEIMINDSIKALQNNDKELLKKVIKKDEPFANKLELSIDKQCINFIARYCPKASNLRTVVMLLKMNNDLERIADNCVYICYKSKSLIEKPEWSNHIADIANISEIVSAMLKDSIKSIVDNDIELAKDVCRRDEQVNKLRDDKINELIKYMNSNPKAIEEALALIRICDRLERIADLSTNIAEDAAFIAKGKVIKHKKK
jgi:phosphate transport system protein